MSSITRPDHPITRLFISAGEASGEFYGAQLISALHRAEPDLDFFGLGGAAMAAAGCDLIVESKEVAVVGLAEVVKHLPSIYSRFHRLLDEVDRRKPALAVLIDFPDFNFRLARELHKRKIPVVYYVSPQLWAWRQSRIELVKKYVDKMLVIFPFEEQYYRERGVKAVYVGHPLSDLQTAGSSREQFAQQHDLDPEKQWIALLPGSRRGEVQRHLPKLVRTAGLLGIGFEFVLPVASTLIRESIEGSLNDATWKGLGECGITLVDDARSTLAHCRAAVVASGTATVEAALIGTPFVVVYRVARLTWALGRRMVNLSHFAMPNLIAGRQVVRELIQSDFTAENVVSELRKIIPDGTARSQMIADLASVRERLKPDSGPAADRAAREVLAVLRANSRA